MTTPFVLDPGADLATLDPLAVGVGRLMAALYRRTPMRRNGRPGRISLNRLRRLADFADEALSSAEASGFLVRQTSPAGIEYVQITPTGLAIFGDQVEVVAEPGDLLAAVGRLGDVLVNVEALARTIGHDDPEATWQALGAIETDGTVERWADAPDGPSVALTALGAGRLGLKLTADGSRWKRAGDPERTPKAKPIGMGDVEDSWFRPGYDDQEEPSKSGLDALLQAEEVGRAVREYRFQMEFAYRAHPDDVADAEAARRIRQERLRAARQEQAERHRIEQRELTAALAGISAIERRARRRELDTRQYIERDALSHQLRLASRTESFEAYEAAAAEDREAVASLAPLVRFALDDKPTKLPRVLIGERPSWPVQRDADGKCGACHGRELAPLETCLVCDRWGLDYTLDRRSPGSATIPEKVAGQNARPRPAEVAMLASMFGPPGATPDDQVPPVGAIISDPVAPLERPPIIGGTDKAPKAKTPTSWDSAFAQLAALREKQKVGIGAS